MTTSNANTSPAVAIFATTIICNAGLLAAAYFLDADSLGDRAPVIFGIGAAVTVVMAIVLTILVCWLVLEGRRLAARLEDFEARGVTRRSRD